MQQEDKGDRVLRSEWISHCLQDDNVGLQRGSMKEEPPDGQCRAEAPEEMPQASTGTSDVDITGLPDGVPLHDSASTAASEPASAAVPAPEPPEEASKLGQASTGTKAPSRKRKAEEGGPTSRKHGVRSARDPSGRWMWRLAATDHQPERTFPLDEGKVASQPARHRLASLNSDGCMLHPSVSGTARSQQVFWQDACGF